ncbi:hypothetical protein CYV26_07715 [Carnobacterium maltaromaticum]|uniref:hypothetical protein n=1 Tax=Carnobacterium maltaromaticum TaxID=2751 RepID=UPI000C76DA88|nr:hypothetical protein [Carnobacterium maltaromaticum]PLS35258.1 hypothetical protein CYV30_10720 [Carnobacterium maltaromaticum]PLS35671.1 hypothetical protein CYV31_10700 [Carnobacterium maltaromaticum]PLS36121.1 hypothetical protein CYV33_07710 [Carnobacterium maltaromaticum]PLS42578.1 hypothetical protein CYV28_10655 [Carnobacterium maltaromaticum]PLS45599.1 hypothetical protein CYV27_07705 [Carnobacterium maltaromaticum]
MITKVNGHILWVLALLLCISFSFSIKSEAAQAEFLPPTLETVMIPEYNEPTNKAHTIQPIPLSTVNILNFVEKSTKGTVNDLLKTVYPERTVEQLQSVTANLNQCAEYVKSQGYKVVTTSGVLDYALLKNELNHQRPVLAQLTANGNYWIEQETAVIIFGVQKFTFQDGRENILYMYRSLNHEDGGIYGGLEQSIPLLNKEALIDPASNVTYKWTGTLYGFTK